ncbi:MAG: aldose 1-epimerase [Acidobacteriota bacterium]|nr:aldose 1-epimerase [Acidobacteriota bacterium]
MRRYSILLVVPVITYAASTYTAEKTTDHGIEIVRLRDAARQVEVSIVPSAGNRAYELKVHGKNLLYFPLPDVAAFKNAERPALNGIPFLAPWANRIAGGSFWADDKKFLFNPDLGTVHVSSSGIAIHGMLTSSPLWKITDRGADNKSAHVTSRLQFWRYPDLMANWPFAHEYEMTYRLTNGVLQVSTTVTNLSAEAMPIVLGFHPYFNIPDVPRSETTAHIPARKHVETDAEFVATGELTAINLPDRVSLKDRTFDDGFTDLIRDSAGRATFSVEAGGKEIEVIYGPKYRVAVIYAPPAQNFICFEPMTAITNGINLAHEGKYPELQTVAPGAVWQESFWISFRGF